MNIHNSRSVVMPASREPRQTAAPEEDMRTDVSVAHSSSIADAVSRLNATVHSTFDRSGFRIDVPLSSGWTVMKTSAHDDDRTVCLRRSSKAAAERDRVQAAVMVAARMLDPAHRHARFAFLPLTFTPVHLNTDTTAPEASSP